MNPLACEIALDAVFVVTSTFVLYRYMDVEVNHATVYFVFLVVANMIYQMLEDARRILSKTPDFKNKFSNNSTFKTRRVIHTFIQVSSFFELIVLGPEFILLLFYPAGTIILAGLVPIWEARYDEFQDLCC